MTTKMRTTKALNSMINACIQLRLLEARHLLTYQVLKKRCTPHHSEAHLHTHGRRISYQKWKPNQQASPSEWDQPFELPGPELDWEFLLDKRNQDTIAENISHRKGVGDIDKVLQLANELREENDALRKKALEERLNEAALDIPNMSHPNSPVGDEDQAREINLVGSKQEFDFKPRMIREIAGKGLRMMRDENLTFSSGSKTYFLEGGLARLERALVAFTVDRLMEKGFELVSVPDLLQCGIVDSCGFKTTSERSQVYRVHPACLSDVCLSGTAEMALAGYFMNEVIPHGQLPKKVMSVSRCYRAEAAEKAIERGLYRVHHFTKVEMFGVTANENGTESDNLLQEILTTEQEIFDELGLHFRVLEMPTQELGAPAHRKYDIEAWMHGKNIWGEISSCSNCTDFQSRRLNIKYKNSNGELRHAHTVNGTGCAVPRMIIAILEQNQQQGRKVYLPKALRPYMGGESGLSGDARAKSWYTFVKTLRRV